MTSVEQHTTSIGLPTQLGDATVSRNGASPKHGGASFAVKLPVPVETREVDRDRYLCQEKLPLKKKFEELSPGDQALLMLGEAKLRDKFNPAMEFVALEYFANNPTSISDEANRVRACTIVSTLKWGDVIKTYDERLDEYIEALAKSQILPVEKLGETLKHYNKVFAANGNAPIFDTATLAQIQADLTKATGSTDKQFPMPANGLTREHFFYMINSAVFSEVAIDRLARYGDLGEKGKPLKVEVLDSIVPPGKTKEDMKRHLEELPNIADRRDSAIARRTEQSLFTETRRLTDIPEEDKVTILPLAEATKSFLTAIEAVVKCRKTIMQDADFCLAVKAELAAKLSDSKDATYGDFVPAYKCLRRQKLAAIRDLYKSVNLADPTGGNDAFKVKPADQPEQKQQGPLWPVPPRDRG